MDAVQRWEQAHSGAGMRGWDFSVLGDRLVAEDPPWDFEADCLNRLRGAETALDMGTGGGERLLGLVARLDRRLRLFATEGWAPNVDVARAALAPAGVPVAVYDAEGDDVLPYADATFDLVMNRHESLDAAEVARVLRPGGRLITQQVDGRDAEELRAWFGGETQYPHVRLDVMTAQLEAAGLVVDEADEWAGRMTFTDVEALVTYLALVPWDVPDFAVRDHVERLQELDASGPINVTQRRFRITARRP